LAWFSDNAIMFAVNGLLYPYFMLKPKPGKTETSVFSAKPKPNRK